MLFTNTRIPNNSNILKIGGTIIERKKCVKFLGIHLDEISSSIYAIKRGKRIVPKAYLHTLYFTMVHPYPTYGIPIWGAAYNVHKRSLFILQKRIIHIINGSKYNDHTNPMFHKLHVLKLDDIYKVQVAKLVVKHKQNSLPLPLQTLFISNSDLHNVT